MEQKIEYLIRSLGIGATYRGYRYLSYGIKLCLENEDYLLSVSKIYGPHGIHPIAESAEGNRLLL